MLWRGLKRRLLARLGESAAQNSLWVARIKKVRPVLQQLATAVPCVLGGTSTHARAGGVRQFQGRSTRARHLIGKVVSRLEADSGGRSRVQRSWPNATRLKKSSKIGKWMRRTSKCAIFDDPFAVGPAPPLRYFQCYPQTGHASQPAKSTRLPHLRHRSHPTQVGRTIARHASLTLPRCLVMSRGAAKCDGDLEQVANPLTRKLRRRQRARAGLRQRLCALAIHPLPGRKQGRATHSRARRSVPTAGCDGRGAQGHRSFDVRSAASFGRARRDGCAPLPGRCC